jgi:hypothetical protein
MRLLHQESEGSFSLIERIGDKIPPYAILSHTWGPEGQGVIFQDIMQVSGGEKDGYAKLRFCAKQAAKDWLDYFWVDTCCII